MTDPEIAALVERLREYANWSGPVSSNANACMMEAASALTRLAAEKQELIEALELAEIADWTHSACDDHDMDVAAEACGSCFGYADAARVARRNALQMRGGEWVIADGTPKDEIAAIIRAALARAKGETE